MKRWLLASVAVAALLAPPPIRAQVIVSDPGALVKLAVEITKMEQQLNVQKAQFGAMMSSLNPNGMAPGLLGQGTGLPNSTSIGSIVTGSGNFASLNGLASTFQQSNGVYMPPSTGAGDFTAQYIQRNSNTQSGIQAMAQQSIASIDTRLAGLKDIQSQLSSARSQGDLAAIQARIAAEQAAIAGQQAQNSSIQTMLAAQGQSYELQQIANQRKSADNLVQRVSAGSTDRSGNLVSTASITTVPTYQGP